VGLLARQAAQEIQLRPANVSMTLNHYLVDARRKHQESSFHTNAIGRSASDREIGIIATLACADYSTLEFLDTLSIAFLNKHVHTYLVAGT